ncbi:MAG: hypothetical protein ABR95_10040 [Sphingobacteriales bacterium BACL12 MAG-120813-bin55]|jgi:hypothetical protein|nr:MAG: hypothetical protein ABR94_11605 [Sphingobacteriales bacterium BACL12 MAG-120802-bin5]KRP13008.1 MAG: hypothetical protein ABR95_10040 [Sphingobacteriales bacterium BACL12 MAG-120813-bin55]
MENKGENSRVDWSHMWEGLYYLSFFILATLVVIPNLGKTLTLGYYYPVAMLIYGTIGVLAGIFVYRLVQHAAAWIKMGIIVAIYLAVFYQLLTHLDRFTIPDM